MFSATLLRIILAFLLLLLGSGFLIPKKANRVAVRAEARKEYTLLRAHDEASKVQTYHLIKGRFFGGNVADPGLEETTFEKAAEHIALNLRRQKYFPEEDPSAGDLLIMVHYGASIFVDKSRRFEDPGYYGDYWFYGNFDLDDYFPPVTTASGEIYEYNLSRNTIPEFYGFVLPSERGYVKAAYVRAKMLGMDDIFNKGVHPYEAWIQVGLADEGRYLFVLTAFDLPLLRQGEKKILWTTRYSIRAIGQSYAQAIKELNIVAGYFFGKNLKGLISRRATDKSLVEFGEIEVLDPEEAPLLPIRN